jgi:thioredoxin 1
MIAATELKRVALGLLLGGSLGFVYQKLVGCRTGTCPLTATPLRAITYGAVIGLLFSLSAFTKSGPSTAASQTPSPSNSREATMASATSVIHLTTGAFDRVKDQARPVIIDFWAPWCGPCRTQGPILDEVSSQMGERAVVAKVNVDEEPGLAGSFGVQAIPTLVIMKGGKIVQRFTGIQEANTLIRALEAAGA